MKKLLSFADDERYTIFTNRDIFRLVIPLFFEQLLFILVGTADTLMIVGWLHRGFMAVGITMIFDWIVRIAAGKKSNGAIKMLNTGAAHAARGSIWRTRQSVPGCRKTLRENMTAGHWSRRRARFM